VLDEADEMLDMGFIDDIETIMKNIPENRQTLLFSATMPKPILSLAEKYMNKPQLVTVSKEDLTVPLIDQYYYETNDKLDGLCRVLDVENAGKTIVFCRTKKGVDELVLALGNRGYLSEALHGDLSQTQRDRVMKKFREGKADILIATDVAARGLDIENITHSINYDIPQDPESYVHRIGRTGRAGNKGIAMTFITPREFRQLKLIEKMINTRIMRKALPTAVNVLEKQRELIVSRMFTVLELGKYSDYRPVLEELLDEYPAEDVALAALKLMQEGNKALVQEEKPSFGNTGGRTGMIRLFINVGRQQRITPEDVVRTIAGEADIPGSSIGLINIYDKFTFVEIPEDSAEKVISIMHKNTIKGYRINVEPARGRE
jgi:ATP-dependent RNA helicase DeaD